VGGDARQPDLGPERAVAAALDAPVRGLAQDREVARHPVRVLPHDPTQPVEVCRDLLVVVEHPGHVPRRLAQLRRERQLHGHTGLHVHRPAAPQLGLRALADEPGGQVVHDRDRVDVTGDDDARGSPEGRPGDDRVPVAEHLEMGVPPQRRLDRVGERVLVAADRRHVAHRTGERDEVRREVQGRVHDATLAGVHGDLGLSA
jgi:hypothetical protein